MSARLTVTTQPTEAGDWHAHRAIDDAIRKTRERAILRNISAQVFAFDLSDPSVHPAVEHVLAGGVASLRAISSEIVGGAR